MLKAGITGGIGSGKSTVARVFALLGVPVYSSDEAARRLLDEDPAIHNGLRMLLGDDAFTGEKPDRKKIAAKVFGNKEKLEGLNAIVHPAVRKHFSEWIDAHKSYPYILKEAAILFESGTYKELDKIITVAAPEDTRIARVMKRDSSPVEDIRKRIESQMSDEEKIKLSDFVIHNGHNDLVIPQVLKVHEELCSF
jgi:dephospho-CoA kinase